MKKQFLRSFILFFLLISANYIVAQVRERDTIPSKVLDVEVIPVIDANYEIERTYKIFFKMDVLLQPDKGFFEIDSLFRLYREELLQEAGSFHSFNPNSLSKYFLESSYRLWGGFYFKLGLWQLDMNKRIKNVQYNIGVLDESIALWQLTLASKDYELVPNNLKIRITDLIDKANEYRSKLHLLKRKYILLEDEITDQIAFVNQILIEVNALQENSRDSLLIAKDPPLIHVYVDSSDYKPIKPRFLRSFKESFKTIENYFGTQNFVFFILFSIVFLVFFIMVRRNYLRMETDISERGHKTILRIFKGYPVVTSLTMVMVFFHLFYPFYPLILNHLITLILLINMYFILKKFIDSDTRHFIFRLIILLIVNDFEIVVWYFGDVARHYILFESLLGILLSLKYLRPVLWQNFKEQKYISQTRLILANLIFFFYLAAFFSNLLGYYDLAILLVTVGIHVPEFTVLLYGLYLITGSFAQALIRYQRSKHTISAYEKYARYERKTLNTIKTLAVIYWFFSLTVSFQVNRLLINNFTEFLEKERNFGLLEITYGSVLSFILILVITFVLTSLLKFLIEKLLKKARLPRGVPVAISVTVGYFIVVAGFLLAITAAGIDLGKFGFIAGALGVGIGFGLQNIVNNFISGLILLYERPLQVGDTIEIKNLLGVVNRIGIRSSNVRTFDGAEVVVPNGNLVSDQLINWTLTDNVRRIEIKVGAAYGSDPNEILKLLTKVPSEHPMVLKEPAPWALFEGFGDSALNFRLLFWTPYDQSLGTKSEVGVGIYNIFKEHGVQIPFPQMDVNMNNKE